MGFSQGRNSDARVIERCAFVDVAQKSLDKIADHYDRVYFGGEYCENMIPSSKALLHACHLLGNKLTWVTPIVSEKGIKKIKEILPHLKSCEAMEVVFNDWGVFHLLKPFKHIKKIQGRVLTRQTKDPNLSYVISNLYQKTGSKIAAFIKDHAKLGSIPEETTGYYGEISENGIFLQGFLKECGIERIELDFLSCGNRLTFPKWLKASVYFPEICMTVSRNCEFKKDYSGDCGLNCLSRKTRLTSKIPPFPPVFLKGNRLCYSIRQDKEIFLKMIKKNPSIDRIIVNQKSCSL
jgi:hypothetical protein